jgi:hypothetical protein
MRQVEGAGVVEGGFVCGDAYFGSVCTAVMVLRVLKVHSTWIIKNNTSFFPKGALLAVLLARHGNRPAGNWVTFTTEIGGVTLYAMAYAWSQKGISFIVSTCGSTVKSQVPYCAWYQDDFGGAAFNELPRPRMAEFILQLLPIIDEDNNARQHRLALERTWPTKNPWFRLLTTIVGQCVVDQLSIYLIKNPGKYKEWTVNMMADHVAAGLTVRHRPSDSDADDAKKYLKRIADKEGHEKRAAYPSEEAQGKTGGVIQRDCFHCKGAGKYVKTSHQCRNCGTPVCKMDRSINDEDGLYPSSCLHEHLRSPHPDVRCNGKPKGTHYPPDKKRKAKREAANSKSEKKKKPKR